MSKLITHIKRLALTLCFVTPLVSWADAITAVNPVTGETETYTYKFIGTDTWNGTEYWQDSNGDNPSAVPAKSGDNIWDPILFDGKTIDIAASMSVEGWNLRLGLYNGANVRLNSFVKWQGDTDMWVTVDGTSKFTVEAFGKGNIADGKVIKCSTTRANGIEWLVNLESTGNANNTFEYYLAGEGSVSYQGVTAANHKIKQADVTLSGNEKSVQSKTLVSFTSTDKTFTADAAIKVKNGDNVLKTVYLTSVTADATTLTAESDVGTCELVQTSTGIDLYWVDGDPANLPAATVYKPSISINFTDSGSGLTTGADVGLTDYEVPGTSWNNFAGSNGTYGEVKAVADSTGSASVMSGVSVTVSGTRGSWATSLPSSSNPLAGYIDENAGNSAPTVTVTGIPYYKYRVLVYHSTDTANIPFGYDTINGTNYTYVEDALSEGTTAWGNSGPDGSANAISEGGNVLVTEALSGSTLTVVGHRAGGANNARGCIAAIQIIEVKADVGENDLEIPVSGDTPYTVEETKELSGTVYLTGSGTLTLAGENKISAATIDVGDLVTLVVNADRLDGTTFTGGGTVVYNNALPVTGKGWTDSAWTGTVWINGKSGVTDFNVNSYGNANSAVKLSGVDGWISAPFDNTVPVVLENGEFEYALKLTNGNSPNNDNPTRCTTFVKVSGSGTIADGNAANPMLKIYNGTEFTGTLTLTRARVVFCAADSTTLPDAYNTGIPAASIYVDSGNSATVASGKTWTADGGFVVNGTLVANGALASSASTAVSGAGTVVFTGRAPTVSGDAWWKNAAWTGTVQIDSITDLVGTSTWGSGTYLDFNSYGNANSVIKLGNITGWLAGDTCNVPVNLAGTLTINNGFSGTAFTFKKLISNGGYITATDQAATARIVIEDGSEYAGYIGLSAKMVVFGTDNPTFVKGQVYVSSDAKITVPAVNTAYWAVGNIVVAGELKADNLARFGGGTHINTTGDGVFTLTSTGNGSENETDTDYARISGTGGSLKYEGTGWRALSTNNFPTAVTLVNEQAGDILLSRAITYTIGSLAGSKNFQGNYGSGSRYLNVIQSKDTEWSGKVTNDGSSRFAGLKLDASSTATLTLSGTATQNVALEVNGGAVNLTGTWVGATTVAGTFGGTGTLTGDLTLTDGATFKAAATALTVSGTVTLPTEEGETLTIDASAIDADEVTIISSESITAETDVSKVTVNGLYTVTPVAGALKLVSTKVAVTIPAIANATVTVSVGGETIGTEAGSYKVAPDAVVTATYAAAQGYEISGQTVYTIDVANSETTFDPAGTTEVKQYVAKIDGGSSYTSLQDAIDATAQTNSKIVLLANEEDGATVPSVSGKSFFIYAGEFTHGTIADAVGDFVTTVTDAEITIDEVEVSAKKYRVVAAVAVVTIPNEGATKYGDYMMAYNAFLAGPVGTTMRVIGENPFSTEIPCTTYDSETQTYTKLAAVASITVGQITTNYPSLADAIEAAEAGQTVKLLADDRVSFADVTVEDGVPSGASIVIAKNLTIAGAGFRVYGKSNADILNATGSATPGFDMVADLVDGSNLLGFFVKSGNVTFTNITLTEFGDTAYVNKFGYTPIQTASAYTGTLTLNNVNFSKFNRTAVCVRGGTLAMTGGTVTANATHKNPNDHCQQPIEVRGGTATISGVTVVSDFAYANNDYGAIVAWGSATLNNVVVDFTGYGIWSDTAVVTVAGEDTSVEATVNAIFAEEGGKITVAAGDFTGPLAVDSDPNSGISLTGGTFDRDVNAFCADGYAATESAGVWTVAEVQEVPVTPGAQTEPVATEEAAQAEAAKVVPSVPAAVAAALTDEQETAYKALFEAKVVEVTVDQVTKYAVEVVMKTDVAEAIQTVVDGEAEDLADAVAEAAAKVAGGTAEITTTPGLYYVVEAGSDVDGIAPASCTLATGNTLDLTLPNKGEKGFYKLRVSVTPVAVPSND